MGERWLGVVVSSDKVTIVDAEVPDTGPIVIVDDLTWDLQGGNRAAAYEVMRRRIANYASENKIASAVIKGSAVSLRGTKKVHLESAELRGVVMTALVSATTLQAQTKASVSRNFGARKADEYLVDDSFWNDEVTGENLRKGSREAALLILAARK